MHMRTPSKSICGLFLAITLLTAPHAEAHSPRAREAVAVIRTINHDKRTLTLDYPHDHGPRELVWNSNTRFLRDWKFVPATELKAGTRMKAYYHSPFFGKPFATKIVWENGR